MRTNHVCAVSVWYDETAATSGSHLAPDSPWTVSTVWDDGQEIECIGSFSTKERAMKRGEAVAAQMGVKCKHEIGGR